jgi:hypothetical protein
MESMTNVSGHFTKWIHHFHQPSKLLLSQAPEWKTQYFGQQMKFDGKGCFPIKPGEIM